MIVKVYAGKQNHWRRSWRKFYNPSDKLRPRGARHFKIGNYETKSGQLHLQNVESPNCIFDRHGIEAHICEKMREHEPKWPRVIDNKNAVLGRINSIQYTLAAGPMDGYCGAIILCYRR